MKTSVRSVPAIFISSAACLSLIALAGCGSSGSSSGTPSGPAAATHIYAIQHTGVLGVSDQDSVVVFSASATGSTTPTSTLMLPSGFVGVSLAVGPQGQIYVGGSTEDNDGFGQILEYPSGSSGSTAPSVTLNGSSNGTATFIYPQNIAVNSAGTLFVSSTDGSLEAFASGFTASATPSQYLTWGAQDNGEDDGQDNFAIDGDSIGVDTAGEIFYADPGNDVIDVFAANATGATAPVRIITGTDTNFFSELSYIAVGGAGDVYVANYNSSDDPALPQSETKPGIYAANKEGIWPGRASRLAAHPHVPTTYEPTEIIEFAAGANGKATPTKRIGGTATKIVEPQGLALDAVGNLYYADANGGYFSDADPLPSVLLEVFPSSATGNVAPAASITSTSYTYPNLNIGDAPPPVTGEFATGVAVR